MTDSPQENPTFTWQRILLPGIIFNLLFFNFVRTNGYFQATADVLLCAGFFAVFGALYGLGMVLLGDKVRVVLLAGLLFFFLDVQSSLFQAPEQKIWHIILLSFMGFCALSWFLLKYLEQIILPVFLLMFVVTLLKPFPKNLPLPHLNTLEQKTASTNSKLPVWIHIILDAHIGLEGIPIEFDPQRKLARKMATDYVKNKFAVFGKAFSQSDFTYRSLRQLFTFSEKGIKSSSYTVDEHKNKYFKKLKQRGYKIHVFQTDEIHLCYARKKNKFVKDCSTYHHQDLRIIGRHPLSTMEKISFLYGTYESSSRMLIRIHSIWNAFRYFVFPTKLNWGRSTIPLVGMELLNWTKRELVHAKRGHAYIVHILLPHAPFSYDENCRLTISPGPDRKSRIAWRKRRYGRYLKQLQCVHSKINRLLGALKKAKVYEDANILIHGDHGSRISLDEMMNSAPPAAKIATKDYLAHYSALFAVKRPHAQKGTYFSFKTPMSYLFNSLAKTNKLPQNAPTSSFPSQVHLTPRYAAPQRATMPSFPSQKLVIP